jgi:ubiquinone/menaquinone biosynthesis C-methylase UbiE
MSIEKLQKDWEAWANYDPLYAILTEKGKAGGQWSIGEFFETGKQEIRDVLGRLDQLKIPLTYENALDFGCGVGRLTQALAGRFNTVYGVDISPKMIELANEHNQHGERVRYVLNERADLSLLPSDDLNFIYTMITLQHIPPDLTKQYLAEFSRVLTKGGALVFQLTDSPNSRSWKQRFSLQYPGLYRVYRRVLHGSAPANDMYSIPKDEVVEHCRKIGLRVVNVSPSEAAKGWNSYQYTCIK